MKNLIFSFLLLVSGLVFSQNQLNPVSWKATYADKGNNEGEIIITATIEDKWHIYSQRPTDAGPIPTSFTVSSTDANYLTIGKVEEQDAHEEYVKAFEAKVFVFEHEAVFKQKIKRKSNKSFTATVSLEFMSCNDMQCLPPKTIDLQVVVPAAANKTKL
jgi:hypothetical protein